MPKAVAGFTFDSSKAAAAAAKTGKSLPALPNGMEGAKLTVTVGPAILEVYGNLKANTNTNSSSSAQDINIPQLVIAESSAPVVTSSQVTAKQLENYILSIPGISKELSAAIKAIGDPSSTLIIPIPIQYATSTSLTAHAVPRLPLAHNTRPVSGV